MILRHRKLLAPLIASIACLPALAGCSEHPVAEPPLSKEALAAVSKDPGAPTEPLARQIDDLFTKPGLGETRAVVVMQGGKIAAERYAPGYDADTRLISWSMAKTVTAVMIGMLVADGRLRLDEPAPVPRWQRAGDPRGEITLRQLLQMRSGLRHSEMSDPPYEDTMVQMLLLEGRDDMADFATAQPLEDEPGRTFEYSTNTTVILADIAARVIAESEDPKARHDAVDHFLKERLFGPLGLTSMVPEYDAHGTLIGGSMIHGTARDWARFGEFLRNKGSYRGVQIVPRNWIEFMTTPSPAMPKYGAQTWLNRPAPGLDEPHELFPDRASTDVFAMIGHMGQYVIVSPNKRVTLVRLGHSTSEQRQRLLSEMADVLALYPDR